MPGVALIFNISQVYLIYVNTQKRINIYWGCDQLTNNNISKYCAMAIKPNYNHHPIIKHNQTNQNLH